MIKLCAYPAHTEKDLRKCRSFWIQLRISQLAPTVPLVILTY